MSTIEFEWDEKKNAANTKKHGISFFDAQHAFADPDHIIAEDVEHSQTEPRYYCFGKARGEVATVRFVRRGRKIRIFGAGYWREGKAVYEEENNL
jgi:uncharacterized DUF497 family protein